jgi:hypothetical protein
MWRQMAEFGRLHRDREPTPEAVIALLAVCGVSLPTGKGERGRIVRQPPEVLADERDDERRHCQLSTLVILRSIDHRTARQLGDRLSYDYPRTVDIEMPAPQRKRLTDAKAAIREQKYKNTVAQVRAARGESVHLIDRQNSRIRLG